MSEPERRGGEFASPAEESLHGQLEVVRDLPPSGGTDLARVVSRTLRWQAIVLVPVTAVLALAGGMVDGLRALVRTKAS